MRIIQISDKLNGFGTPTVFRLTIEALQQDNEIYIASTHMEEGKNRLLLKSWEEPKTLLKRFVAFLYICENKKRLYSFMKENQIDLIHLHSYQKDLSPSVLSAIKKYKKEKQSIVIQTLHDYHLICPNNSFYCYSKEKACHECLEHGVRKVISNCCDYRGKLFSFLRYLRYVLCFSIIRQKEIIDYYIVPSSFSKMMHEKASVSTMLIDNPVDNRYIQFARSIEEKKNQIVFFGRLSPEKNVPLLIEAYSKMKYKDVFSLHIIGDGKQREELENLCKQLGCEERVIFHGKMLPEQLGEIVGKSKISVSPSKCYETFGLTIIESLFMNTIPIVSEVGALKEVVERAGFNTTFESDNIESLKNKIENVIEEYELLFTKLIANKENLIQSFDEKVYQKNIIGFYEKKISESKK